MSLPEVHDSSVFVGLHIAEHTVGKSCRLVARRKMSTLKTMKTFIKPMKMFEICSDHTQIFSTHMETYVEFYVSE